MAPWDFDRSDPAGMHELLRAFPDQAREGIRIGKAVPLRLQTKSLRAVLLSGLGGSAIGGDLMRSYLSEEMSLPFIVNRDYLLPDFVDGRTLVIVSSYSGNTEETISAYRDAVKKRAKIICITSGGAVEQHARKNRHTVVKLPGGLPPRAALGYSFFALLMVLTRLGIVKSKSRDVSETLRLLKEMIKLLGNPEAPENPALELARELHGRLPILYSPARHFDAVMQRWRGQINENAKQLVFGNVLPEMNHNELVGWKLPTRILQEAVVVMLRDTGTHRRVSARESITRRILESRSVRVREVHSRGTSLLARMFSLIVLGDWMSLYLAGLNMEDPTPVKVIDFLKEEMAKT